MITIKNDELVKRVNDALTEEITDEYYVIGIRFENQVRTVGEDVEELSRSNPDREDDRDFPDFKSLEYDDLEVLDGISTWDITFWEEMNLNAWSDSTSFDCGHIYLIGGERHSWGPDDHELVIEDGVVLAVIQ